MIVLVHQLNRQFDLLQVIDFQIKVCLVIDLHWTFLLEWNLNLNWVKFGSLKHTYLIIHIVRFRTRVGYHGSDRNLINYPTSTPFVVGQFAVYCRSERGSTPGDSLRNLWLSRHNYIHITSYIIITFNYIQHTTQSTHWGELLQRFTSWVQLNYPQRTPEPAPTSLRQDYMFPTLSPPSPLKRIFLKTRRRFPSAPDVAAVNSPIDQWHVAISAGCWTNATFA